MADFEKMKRKGTMGSPPPLEEASTNLVAPEVAPPPPAPAPPAATEPAASATEGQGRVRWDGRSARRTGRTVQLATRVSPDFDRRLRAIAKREKLLMVEVLELALSAYETAKS